MKTLLNIESEQFNVRSFDDGRKRVHRMVVSYIDSNGNEYRKRFEYPAKFNSSQMQEARLSIPKHI